MNFVMLDVSIGLAVVCGLVALFCTGIQELLAGYLNLRGKTLWEGIQSMLDDAEPAGAAAGTLSDDLLKHHVLLCQSPRSCGLKGVIQWASGTRRAQPGSVAGMPAYLKAETFASCLADVIKARYAGGATASLADAVARMPAGSLKRVLQSFIGQAEGDEQRVSQLVRQWYDETMGQVSGWYKRRTQFMLLLIGFAVAVVFNVDSIQIFRQLWREPTTRALLVAQAGQLVLPQGMASARPSAAAGAPTPDAPASAAAPAAPTANALSDAHAQLLAGKKAIAYAKQQANALAPSLPVGWPPAWLADDDCEPARSWRAAWTFLTVHLGDLLLGLAGWLLTAGAASMGGPFWFDLVNKLVALRVPRSKQGAGPDRAPD